MRKFWKKHHRPPSVEFAAGCPPWYRWPWNRCTARREARLPGEDPSWYSGRCELVRLHDGDHALERGFDTPRWSTDWSDQADLVLSREKTRVFPEITKLETRIADALDLHPRGRGRVTNDDGTLSEELDICYGDHVKPERWPCPDAQALFGMHHEIMEAEWPPRP